MKIPKSLKLPRKLKKELKKGFVRNVRNSGPVLSDKPGVVSCSMFQTVSYSGSNTKSFRRLCKHVRKDEKRMYDSMVKDTIASMNFNFDGIDEIIQMQRKLNKQTVDEDCSVDINKIPFKDNSWYYKI